MKTVASFASVSHHGWRIQAAWTNVVIFYLRGGTLISNPCQIKGGVCILKSRIYSMGHFLERLILKNRQFKRKYSRNIHLPTITQSYIGLDLYGQLKVRRVLILPPIYI